MRSDRATSADVIGAHRVSGQKRQQQQHGHVLELGKIDAFDFMQHDELNVIWTEGRLVLLHGSTSTTVQQQQDGAIELGRYEGPHADMLGAVFLTMIASIQQ